MTQASSIVRPRFAFALCADDYAMTPGVSRGIVEALDAGALSATSVMTTSRTWGDSAAALKPYVGRADIGLHLNLTLGSPLAAMPGFAPEGALPSIGDVVRRSRRGDLPTDEIAAEIDRQMDAFEAVFGRPPDHVDGHQHVQGLSGIRALVVSSLARRGWRPWLRVSGDRPIRILRRRANAAKALVLAALSRGARAEAQHRGVATNEGFAGFSGFDVAADYGKAFTSYLVAPGTRHLVMCHPGIVDDELRMLDPVVATRERELAFLVSREFRDTLNRAEASLVRLTDLTGKTRV